MAKVIEAEGLVKRFGATQALARCDQDYAAPRAVPEHQR
jgi:hypothetical protein